MEAELFILPYYIPLMNLALESYTKNIVPLICCGAGMKPLHRILISPYLGDMYLGGLWFFFFCLLCFGCSFFSKYFIKNRWFYAIRVLSEQAPSPPFFNICYNATFNHVLYYDESWYWKQRGGTNYTILILGNIFVPHKPSECLFAQRIRLDSRKRKFIKKLCIQQVVGLI